MAENEAVARNILAWETTGIQTTVAGALKVEKSQLDVADANEVVARSSDVAANALDRYADSTALQTRVLAEMEQQAKETGAVVADIPAPGAPGAAGKRPATGADGLDIGRVDTAVSALGTLGASLDFASAEALGVAGDVLGLLDAMGMLTAVMNFNSAATEGVAASEAAAAVGAQGLSTALIPMGLAFAGVTAVAGALVFVAGGVSEAYEENREAATVAASAITEYNRAIAEGTTVDIAAQLDQANADLEVAGQTRADLLAAQAEAWEQETSFLGGDALARVRTALGASSQGAEKYTEAIEVQEQAIIEARGKVDGLTRAMDSAAVAANDAAQATEDATAATIEALQSSSDLEIERARTLRSASEESVAAAIEEEEVRLGVLQRRRGALLALDQASEDVIDALAEADGEIASTSETLGFLSTSATEAAEANDALARSEQRLAEVARETDAALQEIAGADESVAALQERIVENERKAGERRVDLSERLAADLGRINDRIAADAKSNANRLAAIDAAAIKSDIAIADGVAQDEKKARESLADFAEKQAKTELKDEARTLKDIGKLRANARKQEQRAEEDLALGLQEAALARNVDQLIGLQRTADAEASQREEDVAAEITEREADAAERAQDRAADRAERAQESTERIAEIRALAAEERTQRQVETRASIADERAAQQERAGLRAKEFADAEAASEKRAAKLDAQNERALAAIEEQVSEEIAAREDAIGDILALENERTKITAGGIDDIVLAEERLLSERRAAIDGLTANTVAFEQSAGDNLNNIAISFGDIATTVVTNLGNVLQDVTNTVTENVFRQLTAEMQSVQRRIGV